MTFVADQELRDLKSLFKMNRIDPVWHGNTPNLQAVSKHDGKRDGKKYFRKRASGKYPKVESNMAARYSPARLRAGTGAR
jgi:hypothetical protein